MKTDKHGNIILIEKRFMPAQDELSPFYYVGETFGKPEPQQEEPCNKPNINTSHHVTEIIGCQVAGRNRSCR